VKAFEFTHEAYKSGKKDPALAKNDPELDFYYVSVSELQRHPEITPERREEIDTIRREVLKLRHPELPQ
jgi:hypothetical protein